MNAALTRATPDGRFSFEADTAHDAGVVARCLVRQGYTFNHVWADHNFAPTFAETDRDGTVNTAAVPR
jgi:hypothetical protein